MAEPGRVMEATVIGNIYADKARKDNEEKDARKDGEKG